MNNNIIILTIEIYIAGVKNRAGFATAKDRLKNDSTLNSPTALIPADICDMLIMTFCLNSRQFQFRGKYYQ